MGQKLNWVARAWTIYAHLMGMTVVSLVIGFGIVQAISGDNAVITASNVRLLDGTAAPEDGTARMKVKWGGRYGYIYDSDRHESCPGEIVITWSSQDIGAPAVVSVRKPAVLAAVKPYMNVRIDNPLPESVRPGFWTMKTVLVSHCANREQIDPISTFELEVTS